MRSYFFVRVCEPSVDGVHHKRNQNFAFFLGQKALDQCVRNSFKSKRIYESKGRRKLTTCLVELIEDSAEFASERSAFDTHLEMCGTFELGNLGVEIVGPVRSFLDEEKNQFAAKLGSVCERGF